MSTRTSPKILESVPAVACAVALAASALIAAAVSFESVAPVIQAAFPAMVFLAWGAGLLAFFLLLDSLVALMQRPGSSAAWRRAAAGPVLAAAALTLLASLPRPPSSDAPQTAIATPIIVTAAR